MLGIEISESCFRNIGNTTGYLNNNNNKLKTLVCLLIVPNQKLILYHKTIQREFHK